ncbi:MAG: hypothetical protein NWE93_04675 [Candidatus Bathyarchaeota archaeon]|nr:hypothetical protein [Candidatus Bathyarchaeota archaeon]
MSTLNPVWTKQMTIGSQTLDPLGFDKIADRITTDMLTGIVALTTRARYYSFYVWAIKNVIEKEQLKTLKDFQVAFFDRERAYTMACIAHNDIMHNDESHSSIQGLRDSNPKWRNSGSNIDLKNFKHLHNDLGGYGYYYQASIFNLGLTNQDQLRHTLTPLGERLANAFEENIAKTKYFTEFIGKDSIPKSVFYDYGENCCLCLLPKNNLERNMLREIILGTNEEAILFGNNKDRQRTLALLMHIVDSIGSKYERVNDQVFLDILYFRQYLLDENATDYSCPQPLEDTLDKWKQFRAHDYFSFACETFLCCFLKQLSINKKDGLSLEQFVALFNTQQSIDELNKSIISNFKGEPSDLQLTRIINFLIKSVLSDQSEWDRNTSLEFDLKCNLLVEYNESALIQELYKEVRAGTSDLVWHLTQASVVLLLIYLRFYWRLTSTNESWRWLIIQSKDRSREKTDLGVARFVNELTIKLENQFSLKDFVFWISHDYIITQAITINNVKERNSSLYNLPKTWFHEDGSVYRLDRDYTPRLRNSRFSTCTSILDDLGLTTTDNGIHELTIDGKIWLKKLLL